MQNPTERAHSAVAPTAASPREAPGWAEAAIVVALVTQPTVLTWSAVWLAAPPKMLIAALAFGLQPVLSWISVLLAWRWASRRGLAAEVFAFRRLTRGDALAIAAAFLIVFLGVPFVTGGVVALTGSRVWDRSFDATAGWWGPALAVFGVLLTAPIAEEVLHRGLLVAWLQRWGWRDGAIWLVGSLVFAAVHVPLFGPAGATVAFFVGGVILAVRLWRRSLTPCWLVHLLFNARYSLVVPLATLITHALTP